MAVKVPAKALGPQKSMVFGLIVSIISILPAIRSFFTCPALTARANRSGFLFTYAPRAKYFLQNVSGKLPTFLLRISDNGTVVGRGVD